MEKNFDTFTENEMIKFRMAMQHISSYFGKRVVYVKAENVDPLYNKKKSDGLNLLMRPVRKYFTIPLDIKSLNLIKDSEGNPVVVINNDPNLQFELKSDRNPFTKSTDEDIINALRDNSKSYIFDDVDLVVRVIKAENNKNIKFLEDLSNELMDQMSCLQSINDLEQKNLDQYMESIDVK